VVVNNLNDATSLYRNDATASRIGVRLKGRGNSEGIGARITLTGGVVSQSQEMISGGRYLAGDQAMRVFAAKNQPGKPLLLEVTWSSGARSTINDVQPNRIYEVDETGAVQGARAKKSEAKALFKDVSSLINHAHVENAFDDWASQPSLPRRLSRLGPGVSWFDVNGDGWEDLLVGAAAGGKLAVYTNNQGQSFGPLQHTVSTVGDHGSVLMLPGAKPKLLVAASNYEMPREQESELQVYTFPSMTSERLPAGKASLGPMALGDVDGDGDLDLFVGGRFRPGHYPEAAPSTVWWNDGGTLKLSPDASRRFESVGLVSGVTFSDFDGDGSPDLALALEWGTVRIFGNDSRNDRAAFRDIATSETAGWWTSVTAGDFDGDGRMDLAVGNWGRNSMYELYRPTPPSLEWPPEIPRPVLGMFFGDWNRDGRITLLEAWQSGKEWLPVHNKNWIARTAPGLIEKFPTHQTFAAATLQQIVGTPFGESKVLKAKEFHSGVFLSRGMRFDWIPFPPEAQLAPVFAVNVGDFDADGNEDLFLSQNSFSAVPEDGSAEAISRDDSGRGLWLRGSGRGTFTAVDGSVTGIKIYGEQRGAALADFNHDGRVDLCVSQNNGATKLYVNETGRRGLRVTLRGTTENPDAVGAQIRLRYAGGRMGPCRGIAAGSGYWSQDASAQVLGFGDARPEALWIRWPGGAEQTVPLQSDSQDVRVEFSNQRK
jgi:hypothetical protein